MKVMKLCVSPIWGAENLICIRSSSTTNHLNPWLLSSSIIQLLPPATPKNKKQKSGQINKVVYVCLSMELNIGHFQLIENHNPISTHDEYWAKSASRE